MSEEISLPDTPEGAKSVALKKRIAELEAALCNLIVDCDDYERINNLSGTWAAIEHARKVLCR